MSLEAAVACTDMSVSGGLTGGRYKNGLRDTTIQSCANTAAVSGKTMPVI